jgi:hypothetical protein
MARSGDEGAQGREWFTAYGPVPRIGESVMLPGDGWRRVVDVCHGVSRNGRRGETGDSRVTVRLGPIQG